MISKTDLQSILNNVICGEKVQIKLCATDGVFIILPIENIEIGSDAISLNCRSGNITFEQS